MTRSPPARVVSRRILVATGAPIFELGTILERSTVAITGRYAHFALESRRAAIDSLCSVLAGAGSKGTQVRR